MSRSIEWRHDGRRIVLPVTILRPTPSLDLGGYPASALIDTGATTSGIAPRVARALDLVPRGKRPMGHAQGEGQVERYVFRIAMSADRGLDDIPGFPYVFDDLVGFELTDSFVLDALIGMDILSQCDLRIDRSRHCTLRFG